MRNCHEYWGSPDHGVRGDGQPVGYEYMQSATAMKEYMGRYYFSLRSGGGIFHRSKAGKEESEVSDEP